MDRGVPLLIEFLLGLEHAERVLRGGAGVQVDERLAVDVLLQDREVVADPQDLLVSERGGRAAEMGWGGNHGGDSWIGVRCGAHPRRPGGRRHNTSHRLNLIIPRSRSPPARPPRGPAHRGTRSPRNARGGPRPGSRLRRPSARAAVPFGGQDPDRDGSIARGQPQATPSQGVGLVLPENGKRRPIGAAAMIAGAAGVRRRDPLAGAVGRRDPAAASKAPATARQRLSLLRRKACAAQGSPDMPALDARAGEGLHTRRRHRAATPCGDARRRPCQGSRFSMARTRVQTD